MKIPQKKIMKYLKYFMYKTKSVLEIKIEDLHKKLIIWFAVHLFLLYTVDSSYAIECLKLPFT